MRLRAGAPDTGAAREFARLAAPTPPALPSQGLNVADIFLADQTRQARSLQAEFHLRGKVKCSCL